MWWSGPSESGRGRVGDAGTKHGGSLAFERTLRVGSGRPVPPTYPRRAPLLSLPLAPSPPEAPHTRTGIARQLQIKSIIIFQEASSPLVS